MDNEKPGTALITGATSGMGEAFARHLAADGYDLLLVARREILLEKIARELETEHGVNVEIQVADLSREEGVAKIVSLIERLGPLAMLINNAGFGVRGKFAKTDVEDQVKMIMVHDVCPVRLIHAALPGMMEAGRGDIINVSSIVGLLAWPGGSKTYGGSKAFLVNFSDGLHQEIAGSGVRIQALCPGFIRTGFHQAMGENMSSIPDFLWMAPEKVVKESLAALKKKKTIFIPGMRYRIIVFVSRIIPGFIMQNISKAIRKKVK